MYIGVFLVAPFTMNLNILAILKMKLQEKLM